MSTSHNMLLYWYRSTKRYRHWDYLQNYEGIWQHFYWINFHGSWSHSLTIFVLYLLLILIFVWLNLIFEWFSLHTLHLSLLRSTRNILQNHLCLKKHLWNIESPRLSRNYDLLWHASSHELGKIGGTVWLICRGTHIKVTILLIYH